MWPRSRKVTRSRPGAAAEVEDAKGRRPPMEQQRRDVLADVVIARAGAVGVGEAPVVGERAPADLSQLVPAEAWPSVLHAPSLADP